MCSSHPPLKTNDLAFQLLGVLTAESPWHACLLSCFSSVWLFVSLWVVAHQAPLSMGFSRQEYWSGLPCPPGELPHSGIEPMSLMSPALEGGFLTTLSTWEAQKALSPPQLAPSKDSSGEGCHLIQDHASYGGVVVQSLSHVRLFVTPRTAAFQAPLSSTISWIWIFSNSCPLGQWCYLTI